MKNTIKTQLKSLLPILLATVVIVYWLQTTSNQYANQQGITASNSYRATVKEEVEEGQVDLGGTIQSYQILRVVADAGPWQGTSFDIDYGKRQLRAPGPLLKPGDRILISISEVPNQAPNAYFVDYIRIPALATLLGVFVIFSVIISRWKGIRGLIAMALSLAIILDYILPNILQGKDPVVISIIGSFVILAVTLYTIYGWTLKTHSAVLGMLISLAITGLAATLFVNLAHMTGFGSEEAMYLSTEANSIINFRGIVLGGIIIGSLGVLDDLVISQASAIFELYLLDPTQAVGDLFRRGMRIGQDHVAATINTLVLAYTGAALPLLLLVSGGGRDWFSFLNREAVAEEIIRTLVGSLGLMSAVPITTALAALIAKNMPNFGKLRRYLGPATKVDLEDRLEHHH